MAGAHATLPEAMAGMSSVRARNLPAGGAIADLYAVRFAAFKALHATEQDLRRAMAQMPKDQAEKNPLAETGFGDVL